MSMYKAERNKKRTCFQMRFSCTPRHLAGLKGKQRDIGWRIYKWKPYFGHIASLLFLMPFIIYYIFPYVKANFIDLILYSLFAEKDYPQNFDLIQYHY